MTRQPTSKDPPYHCPLLGRDIKLGPCLDLNLELIRAFRADALPQFTMKTGKTRDEIESICNACPNNPL